MSQETKQKGFILVKDNPHHTFFFEYLSSSQRVNELRRDMSVCHLRFECKLFFRKSIIVRNFVFDNGTNSACDNGTNSARHCQVLLAVKAGHHSGTTKIQSSRNRLAAIIIVKGLNKIVAAAIKGRRLILCLFQRE